MLLTIIDGTGEFSNAGYKKSMAGGFCTQLEKLAQGRYYRGPSMLGFETFDTARTAFADLLARRREGADVVLAGHSRGGAAVIYVAKLLMERDIDVKAMFLFDAVDRTVTNTVNVQSVPANVKRCYHARRDRSLATYYEAGVKSALKAWNDCLSRNPGDQRKCDELGRRYESLAEQDLKMKRVMRSTWVSELGFASADFGNCGTSGDPGCVYVEQVFLGSHGALGGAPIVDESAPKLLIDSDRAAIASVRSWMWGNLVKEGVLKGLSGTGQG